MNGSHWIVNLIGGLSPLLIGLVGWLGTEATKLIRARTQNELLAQAMGKLSDVVVIVVAELEQTIVRSLKEHAADGHLSPADMATVKKAAVDKVKSYLGTNGLALLAQALKLDEGAVDMLIKSKIEATVLQLKLPKPAPAPAPYVPQPLPPFLQGNPK